MADRKRNEELTLYQGLMSWCGHARQGNTYRLRCRLFDTISSRGRRPISRVLRGGSFNNQPSNVRSANRNNVPTNRNNNNGLRLARAPRGQRTLDRTEPAALPFRQGFVLADKRTVGHPALVASANAPGGRFAFLRQIDGGPPVRPGSTDRMALSRKGAKDRVCFRPDGQRIMEGSGDETVKDCGSPEE